MQVQGVLGGVATAAIRVRAVDVSLQLGEGAPATGSLCLLASCGVLLAVHVVMVRRSSGSVVGLHGRSLVRHVDSCTVVHVLSRVGWGTHVDHTHVDRVLGLRCVCVCVVVVDSLGG